MGSASPEPPGERDDRGAPSPPDRQQAVIAFLARPESYGLSGGEVERVETHGSIVFLVADKAYKLKRAIAFGSLDYRTVARREAACRAELALNRPQAPALYLGLRSIGWRPDGALAFDAPDEALDWVVVLRRFAQSTLFDRIAGRDGLTVPLIRALGRTIARFHARAPVAFRFGGRRGLRKAIEETHRELVSCGDLLDPASVTRLTRRSLARLARLSPLVERRRRAGRVRRCHGDLRLANICLFDGRPTLFDAVEFSDEIACIDVLYDLAFLLMDLWCRGRDDLARAALAACLERPPRSDELAVLPLFLSMRAALRSYSLAQASRRRPAERAALAALARYHLEVAARFLRDRPAACLAPRARRLTPIKIDGWARF